MFYGNIINNIQKETQQAFKQLDLTTGNISNMNTDSYKQKRLTAFGEVMTSMKPGSLKATEDKQDVSLQGQGFFELTDDEGNVFLTRNLYLETDKEYNLKSGGKYLLPKDTLTRNYIDFEIKPDGELLGFREEDGTEVPLGHIKVVNYPASHKLDFDGEFFRPTEEAGKSQEIPLGKLSRTKVRQKTKEVANINLPFEYIEFNQTNKKLQTLTSLLQSINQSRRQYIQTLGQLAAQ